MLRYAWRMDQSLDLHRLDVFRHVYEARSFSAAARRLELSQPTVSVHVKALEDALGVVLFNRLGREVEPTDAADLVYQRAVAMLELRQGLLEQMQGFRQRLEGDLEVGASTIPGEYLLAPTLVAFRRTHPGVTVRVHIRDTGEIIEEVAGGQVQLGFVGGRRREGELEYRVVARDRLVCVAPPESPWARRGRVHLEDLAAAPLLLREEGSGTRMGLEQALEEHGLGLGGFTIAAELGSTAAIKEAVREGLGVSFISDRAVRSEQRARLVEVVTVEDLPPVERDFYLVWDPRRAPSPLAEAMLEQLGEPPSL